MCSWLRRWRHWCLHKVRSGCGSVQTWSLSLYKAAARRRLQAAAARLFCTRRSGRSARRAARENYSPLLSLSLCNPPPLLSFILLAACPQICKKPTVTKHENFSTEMAKQAVSPLICWTFLIRPRSDHCISCPKVQSMGSTTS